MSLFTSQTFQTRYRSGDITALPKKFYNDVLPMTKKYCRAVGFFSSTSFIEISYGLLELIKNDGKMYLITSPKLREDDVEAIKKGYKSKEQVYIEAFNREMDIPKTINEKNRLNILANLIEAGILEIKIAVTDNPAISMYHEKIGTFEDEEGNIIAISGSMNESETAISDNFESFQVFCGWKEGDVERVRTCVEDFNAMWENKQKSLKVFKFPELPQVFIQKYKTSNIRKTLLKKENEEDVDDLIPLAFETINEINNDKMNDMVFFHFNDGKSPRKHQRKAIKRFIECEFQCLFAMATGTGKTLTSLFAAAELSCYVQLNSILIIVPLKDLVDQWESDISKYFFGTIISVHSEKEWKEKITDISLLKLLNKENNERLVIITTYNSFSLNNEKLLSALGNNSLIIADEVHKFGAQSYSQKLPENIKWRIGLSATPKRPFDDKGTQAIFDYFCPSQNYFEFSIKDAIDADMLCHYNYYPIIVKLTDEEMEKYDKLSDRISKLTFIHNNEKEINDDDKKKLEELLKERHRIIEHANNKLELFLERMTIEIKKYKDKTIVFCPDGFDDDENNYLFLYKQALWTKLIAQGKIIRMSEYIQNTPKQIIDNFKKGAIDILLTKQRLNEGIDIPAAKRAFFISSSTSEREFIQRRGRVLRNSPGKKIAEIFDFIVVPPNMNSKNASSILRNEIRRAMDFAYTADNYSEIEMTLRTYL